MYGTFEIANKESLFVKLVDRDGDDIVERDLPKMLRQYKSDSNFFVEMIFSSGVITSLTVKVISEKTIYFFMDRE